MFGLGILDLFVPKVQKYTDPRRIFLLCCWRSQLLPCLPGRMGSGELSRSQTCQYLAISWVCLNMSILNWNSLKSTKLMRQCTFVWWSIIAFYQLVLHSPIILKIFLWFPSCLVTLSAAYLLLAVCSQHPVKARFTHNDFQHDFTVLSSSNLCRKYRAIPGTRSLAGNSNFTERSNITVVMKTRQKQKTVNIFIATGAISIHRAYTELSAMPLLIWDPVKTKFQVKFLAWPLHQVLVSFSAVACHWLHYEIH